MIKITKEKYNELIEAEMTLNSLYGAGVDNWNGWSIAMELLDEMKEINKKLDDENEKYADCDECTPLGYYLSDGEYISCESAHRLGLI